VDALLIIIVIIMAHVYAMLHIANRKYADIGLMDAIIICIAEHAILLMGGIVMLQADVHALLQLADRKYAEAGLMDAEQTILIAEHAAQVIFVMLQADVNAIQQTVQEKIAGIIYAVELAFQDVQVVPLHVIMVIA